MHSRLPAGLLRNITAMLLAVCCAAGAHAQGGKPQHAKLSLISELASLSPGTTDWIGIRFQLEPGWHIYWKNPGDSGEPPKVTWHLPSGVEATNLYFPTPRRIQDHSLIDYGYEGEVVLLAKLVVPNSGGAPSGNEIAADVRYLVCREICVPGRDHVALTLSSAASSGPSAATDSDLIRKTETHLPLPLPADVKLSARSEGDSIVVSIASKRPEFRAVKDFLPEDTQVLDNTAAPKFDFVNGAGRLTLKKSEQLDHSIPQLKGLLVTTNKAYEVTIPVNSRQISSRKVSGKT